jgi:hypothetical protein
MSTRHAPPAKNMGALKKWLIVVSTCFAVWLAATIGLDLAHTELGWRQQKFLAAPVAVAIGFLLWFRLGR